jgi:hypothetical protein
VPGLNWFPDQLLLLAMNLIYGFLAWLAIAFVLGLGLYLAAVKGTPWLLIVSVIAFIVAVGKIGCQTK